MKELMCDLYLTSLTSQPFLWLSCLFFKHNIYVGAEEVGFVSLSTQRTKPLLYRICFHCAGLRPSELRGPDGPHQRRFSLLQQRLCGMCASAVVLAGLHPSRVWPFADACTLNSHAFRPTAVFLRLCKTCDQDDHKVCWAQPATFRKNKSFRLTYNSSADLTRMIMQKDEISSFAAHVWGDVGRAVWEANKHSAGKCFSMCLTVAASSLWALHLDSTFHHIRTSEKKKKERQSCRKCECPMAQGGWRGAELAEPGPELRPGSSVISLGTAADRPEPEKTQWMEETDPLRRVLAAYWWLLSILKEGQETLFLWRKVAETKHPNEYSLRGIHHHHHPFTQRSDLCWPWVWMVRVCHLPLVTTRGPGSFMDEDACVIYA